jgi:hypothetical protein
MSLAISNEAFFMSITQRPTMNYKSISFVVAGATLLLVGFAIGRFPRTHPTVVVYGEKAQVEYVRALAKDPDVMRLAEIMGKTPEDIIPFKPYVKAGPFVVFREEITGNYTILKDRQLMVMETSDGDETTVAFYGRGQHASCEFTYKHDTKEVVRVVYTAYGEKGALGMFRHCFFDTNGDDRFDRFFDGSRLYTLTRVPVEPKEE